MFAGFRELPNFDEINGEEAMAGSYVGGVRMHKIAERAGRGLSIQLSNLVRMEVKGARRLIGAGYPGKLYYARSLCFCRRRRPLVHGYGAANFVIKEMATALLDMT